LVLDIASLTPDTTNTDTTLKDKDDDSILVGDAINLDYLDPREVVVGGGLAYVSHFSEDKISVIDTTTRTKIDEITVGDE
mgnify:CR=1